MKKNLVISILIITLLILIIICILAIIYLQQNEDTKSIDTENIITPEEETIIEIIEIQDIKKILSIENIIRVYFEDIYIAESEIQDSPYAVEGGAYPILRELGLENDDKIFYIKEAYILDLNRKNSVYFIKGNLINKNISIINKEDIIKEEVLLTLTLDKENNTFDISKYGNKYKDYITYKDNIIDNELKLEKLKELEEDITKEYLNIYIEKEFTDEEVAYRYFEDYKINALYFQEDAYKMIDEQYKKERFSTFESYKEYLQKYRTFIEESALSKYSIDNMEGNVDYTLIDTYQNNYVIKTSLSPMNYTIYLDNYTIKSEGYEERYSKLSNENKVSTNATIFMFMINTGDYAHAYELLADSFKSNNFKSLTLFEKYINNNFFKYNIVNISSIKQKGSYYICNIELRNNNSSASETKDLEIIMKLEEGTDFVMSFNIK